MFTKELHIKNRTLGIGLSTECKHSQKLYALQLYRKIHAKQIGQDTTETYFTIGILCYGKCIKVVSHRRTHIKQRIA